jgi:hypothetical protein
LPLALTGGENSNGSFGEITSGDYSRYADQPRLPFESRPAYSVNPAPGLIVIFPSWIPHNQHPYRGEVTHIQVVLNFRVEIPEHLQEKWFD